MATKSKKEHAWQKGRRIKGKNPNLYRKDDLGNELYKPAYGKGGDKGWEIDHKKPKRKGGSDSKKNLRPLSRSGNRRKGGRYPHK